MALSQADRQFLAETLGQLVTDQTAQIVAHVEELRGRVDVFEERFNMALGGFANALPKLPTPEALMATVRKELEALPAATAETIREAAPHLFEAERTKITPAESGPLSRHHWVALKAGSYPSGAGVIEVAKDQAFDERSHDVPLMRSRGILLRRMYRRELAERGLKE